MQLINDPACNRSLLRPFYAKGIGLEKGTEEGKTGFLWWEEAMSSEWHFPYRSSFCWNKRGIERKISFSHGQHLPLLNPTGTPAAVRYFQPYSHLGIWQFQILQAVGSFAARTKLEDFIRNLSGARSFRQFLALTSKQFWPESDFRKRSGALQQLTRKYSDNICLDECPQLDSLLRYTVPFFLTDARNARIQEFPTSCLGSWVRKQIVEDKLKDGV